MDLAGNLRKAERGVKVVADGVLGEGLDFGVSEAGGAEVTHGVLEECAAQASVTVGGGDGEVGDMAHAGGAVLPGGDVADDLTGVFGHKNTGDVAGDVVVDVAGLAPLPVVAVDRTERFLDAVIDRDALKAFDGETLEVGEVGWDVGADVHEIDFRFRMLDFGLGASDTTAQIQNLNSK